MKKRITLTLSVETVNYLKSQAKERGITVYQFAEEMFLKFIAECKAEEKLKKVS